VLIKGIILSIDARLDEFIDSIAMLNDPFIVI
jgi:hypothetical protein